MGTLIKNAVEALAKTQKGTFVGNSENEYENNVQTSNVSGGAALLVAIITFVVTIIMILLLSKYLWNNCLVALIPAVQRAESVWQILGLAILISLMNL